MLFWHAYLRYAHVSISRSLFECTGLFIWLIWHVYLSLGEAHDIAPRESDPQALTNRKQGLHPGEMRCAHVREVGWLGACVLACVRKIGHACKEQNVAYVYMYARA